MEEFKQIDRKQIYKGKIFEVVQDTLIMPNGKEGKFDLVLHNGASAIVPLCDDGKVILVRQYRHAVGKSVLEIPAGKLEKGENPLKCAYRELEEETSFKSNNLTHLLSMYSAIGFCTEVLHIYLAKNLVQGEFNFDDDEFIDIEKYTFDEIFEFIKKGEIVDSKTIAAITYAKQFLEN